MPAHAAQANLHVRAAAWARELSEEQLQRVERETRVQLFPAGSVVCREGQPAEHWVGVIQGIVKVCTTFADGRSTTFIGVTDGGWLGEGALLKRELRPYEVLALRESRVALMPLRTFEWLYQTSLPFNHFLIQQLNARLGQFVALVESKRMQSTVGEVAISLAELFNPALSPNASEFVRISQEELAQLCGVSRAITNRALHQLQDAGLVRIHYKGVQALDVQGLYTYARGQDQQVKPGH
jgi:CRP/FNR family cyclic AMP-dependent transcriptional regulator